MSCNKVYFGSVVLGMIYPDAVVLVADTKQIAINNSVVSNATNILKIHEKGKYFFACTGFLKSFSPDIDVASIINQNIVVMSSYADNVKTIKSTLEKYVYQMADALFQNQHQYFLSRLNTNFLTVLITTFENGIPKCGAIHFKLLPTTNNGKWEIKVENIELRTTPAFIPIGEYEAVDSTLNANPKYWKQFPNIIDALKELVKIQSKATPDLVGMPCDVVIIKKDSHEWKRNLQN